MNYSNKKPPVWDKIVARFPVVKWEDGVIVAYGNTYYCIEPKEDHYIVHEETHTRQQRAIGGPEIWWDRYLHDTDFRLTQEVEAYQNQYNFLKQKWQNFPRNQRRSYLRQFVEFAAQTLSGPVYGNMITYNRAMSLLK